MSRGVAAHDSDYTFGKRKRLLNAADYSRVFDDTTARASHRHLLLLARPNQQHGHRLGLVVAKKNVRLAAQRNRVKRIVREVFRHQSVTDPALDVVFLARRGIDRLDNAQLSSILREQWQHLATRVSIPNNSQET